MVTDPPSLASVLRQFPYLSPADSVHRALDILRHFGADTLPVLGPYGRLLGVITLDGLRPLAGRSDAEASAAEPVANWMRPPDYVGRADMSVAEVRRALASGRETTLFVVDSAGRLLGAVTLADLLTSEPVRPRPNSVGGMATPWGVYLTTGTLQAGSSNLVLALSGVVLGLLLAASHVGVGLFAWCVERLSSVHLYALWNADQPSLTLANAEWYGLHALSLPLFALMVRLLPLTGYHAAEHQAVHTLERGEPLRPEVARRMPRVHPRCGTNLMAGGLLFGLVSQALPALHIGLDATDSAVLGALVAVFTWRSFGAFLQQYVTTRPASERQLASGLAAAEELERRFALAVPHRPTLARRVWCSGMLQTGVGIAAGATAALTLSDVAFHLLH